MYEGGLTVVRIAKVLLMSKTTVYREIGDYAEEKGRSVSAKKGYSPLDPRGVPCLHLFIAGKPDEVYIAF